MRDYSGFFTGRVDLSARGSGLEQFINLLHRQGLRPRNLSRSETGELLFTLPKKAFPRLRAPAFKTGTRVRILKKRGLFMVLRPYRRRIGLLAGVLLFIGFMLWCSGYIWRVEIKGCEKSSQTQLLEELKPLGFWLGCRRDIDVGAIENRYLIGNERFSWLSINIKGTTAYIEVKEKDLTPEIIKEDTPTHIFAARDGVITAITDFSGERMVEVGDAVKAGDLLISGERTDYYGVVRRVRSVGKITARTFHTARIKVPYQEEIRQNTGRKKKFLVIFLGKVKIPLYFNKKISYNDYDIVSKEQSLHFGAFALPIRWQATTYREVEQALMERGEKEAREAALYRLALFERDRLSAVKILERKEQFLEEEGALVLEAIYTCEEMIGYEKKIED